MDDEKSDIKEYLTKTTHIEVEMEFYLEEDSPDGRDTSNLFDLLKNQVKHLHPFENSKSSYSLSWPQKGKKVLTFGFGFQGHYSVGKEFVLWSSRQEEKFKKNLVQATANFKTPEAKSCTGADGEVATSSELSKLTPKQPFPSMVSLKRVMSSSVSYLPSVIFPHKWMDALDSKMRKVPFTMLAIPGTHNSATHTMQKDHFQAYDSPAYTDCPVRPYLSFMTPEALASWGRCVKHNIIQQLEMGMRYFDFRLKITI